MLRIHLLQQWFELKDQGAEEALLGERGLIVKHGTAVNASLRESGGCSDCP